MTRQMVATSSDARAIGALYQKSKGSLVDSVKYYIAAGIKLKAKKEALDHGQWEPWLRANKNVLGFGERVARRMLLAASNRTLAADLTEQKAIEYVPKMHGHVKKQNGSNRTSQTLNVNECAEQAIQLFNKIFGVGEELDQYVNVVIENQTELSTSKHERLINNMRQAIERIERAMRQLQRSDRMLTHQRRAAS